MISPQAGFGNRLRAVCSAAILGPLLGRQVFHAWTPDVPNSQIAQINTLKTVGYNYVFDDTIPRWTGAVDVCLSEWLPGDYWYASQSTAQRSLPVGRTERMASMDDLIHCADDVVLVETSHELVHPALVATWLELMRASYKTSLRLNPRWQSIFDSIPRFDNGIWVRRGEFLQYFEEAHIDTAQLCHTINRLGGSKVILSDDHEFRDVLRARTDSPFGYHVASEIDSFIIGFLTLARSRKVFGTTQSSFALQAALFGGGDYLELTRSG